MQKLHRIRSTVNAGKSFESVFVKLVIIEAYKRLAAAYTLAMPISNTSEEFPMRIEVPFEPFRLINFNYFYTRRYLLSLLSSNV